MTWTMTATQTTTNYQTPPTTPAFLPVAVNLMRRKWLLALGDAARLDELTQQAWLYYLEGWGDPPASYERDDQIHVWNVGKLASRLNGWCKKLYHRKQRELPLQDDLSTEDYRGGHSDGIEMTDVLDLIGATMTDEEAACVFFRASGYEDNKVQEILGMTPSAYRVKLHRLRARMKDHASRQ